MDPKKRVEEKLNSDEDTSRLKQELAAAFAGLFGLLIILAGISTAVILAAAFHMADHHAVWF